MTIALPAVDNYPAIEGVVDNAFQRGCAASLAWLPQMRMMKKHVSTEELVTWCNKAHAHATTGRGPGKAAPLDFTRGSYYVVAYVPHALSPLQLESLPRGTVVVGLEALKKLLGPLGAFPLLEQLRATAGDRGGAIAPRGGRGEARGGRGRKGARSEGQGREGLVEAEVAKGHLVEAMAKGTSGGGAPRIALTAHLPSCQRIFGSPLP